jgi:hypothetical protein
MGACVWLTWQPVGGHRGVKDTEDTLREYDDFAVNRVTVADASGGGGAGGGAAAGGRSGADGTIAALAKAEGDAELGDDARTDSDAAALTLPLLPRASSPAAGRGGR